LREDRFDKQKHSEYNCLKIVTVYKVVTVLESTERRLQNVAERMRAEGYRLPPQRIAIPHVLLHHHDHPTADDVYQQAATQFPMMSRATVYETLNILEALGEVSELQMEARKHYDGNATAHPHLTCVKCCSIVDLLSPAMPELPEHILADTGFRILGYNLRVLGLCPKCQAPEEQPMSKSSQRKENLE
jgi:Fur family peroxide stress response transcriptional regulator